MDGNWVKKTAKVNSRQIAKIVIGTICGNGVALYSANWEKVIIGRVWNYNAPESLVRRYFFSWPPVRPRIGMAKYEWVLSPRG